MNARLSHARGGFTLIEMVITLCIFVMLAAAVFGIFSATLESVGSLQDNQNHEDQAEALGAWLKQSFLALPADGTILSLHREGAPFEVADLIWGDGDELRVLDLHLQADGNYTLRLASFVPSSSSRALAVASLPRVFADEVTADDPSLEWRPLIRNIKTADWRFRLPNAAIWQDSAPGSLSAVTDDFWIPPLQPPNNLVPAPAATVTANP
jgi:prepilin-type N-terminal cleavage/methylation domain-containing protein